MKREKLETYIGRQVKVLLFDGRAYKGCLQKTNTDAVKHNPNLYWKHNYYALLDKGASTTIRSARTHRLFLWLIKVYYARKMGNRLPEKQLPCQARHRSTAILVGQEDRHNMSLRHTNIGFFKFCNRFS